MCIWLGLQGVWQACCTNSLHKATAQQGLRKQQVGAGRCVVAADATPCGSVC
jgi:hypothetical protein